MTDAAPRTPDFTRLFADEFAALVDAHGERPAVIAATCGTTLTYAQLGSITTRLAAMLIERTADSAAPLVISALPNSLEALVLFLAALRAGIDFAPLNPQASDQEALRLIDLVNPALVALAPDSALRGKIMERGVPTLATPVDGRFAWLDSQVLLQTPPLRTSNLYLYTSGSTGEPKALVIDSDRLWQSGKAFITCHDFVDSNARFFNCLPMYYLAGIYNLGLIPLSLGASIVIGEAFSGRALIDFWRIVSRHEVNVLWLVPTIVRSLVAIGPRNGFDDTCAAVRAGFLGTAPIELSTKQKFESVFRIPILENFALSETVFLTSETMASRVQRAPSSVGEILPFIDLRLVERDDPDQEDVVISEIQVKTPYIFRGYLEPDGSLDTALTSDGYFRTGDVGHMVNGNTLIIDGRMRDIVKKGGVLIALREIECEAERCPGVAEAAAVRTADPLLGEDFALFVRWSGAKQSSDESERKTALERWLCRRLAPHKQPAEIHSCDDFPRTPSGKIRKHLIAANCMRRTSDPTN